MRASSRFARVLATWTRQFAVARSFADFYRSQRYKAALLVAGRVAGGQARYAGARRVARRVAGGQARGTAGDAPAACGRVVGRAAGGRAAARKNGAHHREVMGAVKFTL